MWLDVRLSYSFSLALAWILVLVLVVGCALIVRGNVRSGSVMVVGCVEWVVLSVRLMCSLISSY